MDNFFLTGPQGSTINLGSWLQADPGPQFDNGYFNQYFTEGAVGEGGLMTYESYGVRRFQFPLILASNAAMPSGLAGAEDFLRESLMSGGYIDMQPHGVPTAARARFDVLGGEVVPKYNVHHQREGRRLVDVVVKVEPIGYSPSLLILASAASVGMPGRLTINPASVIGDMPALAELVFQPTVATQPIGTYVPDGLMWSMSGQASFVAWWPAASLASTFAATLVGDSYAPGSQAIGVCFSPTTGWTTMIVGTIPQTLEPAYRGYYRAFALAKLGGLGSNAVGVNIAIDAAPNTAFGLASTGYVGSLPPNTKSASAAVVGGSPGYHLLDLGPLALPAAGSGIAQSYLLRLWCGLPASVTLGASPRVDVAGVFLLPQQVNAGILQRGLAIPSSISPSAGRFVLDAINARSLTAIATGDLATQLPARDTPFYRGQWPVVSASTVGVDVLSISRRSGVDWRYPEQVLSTAVAPVYHWPMNAINQGATPTFIAPFSASNGPTMLGRGRYATHASSLIFGANPSDTAVLFTGSTIYAATGIFLPSQGPWTVEMLLSIPTIIAGAAWVTIATGPSTGGGWGQLAIGWNTTPRMNFGTSDALNFGSACVATQSAALASPNGQKWHVIAAYTGNAPSGAAASQGWFTRWMIINGSVVACHQLASSASYGLQVGSGNLYLGGATTPLGLTGFSNVVIDALSIYPSVAIGPSEAQQRYTTAFTATGGPSSPALYAAPFTAMSVRYRPRWRFMPGA